MAIYPRTNYDVLGEFISDQSPYSREVRLPPLDAPDVFEKTDAGTDVLIKIPLQMFLDNHVVVKGGLHENADADHPIKYLTDEELDATLTPEEKAKILKWHFAGVDHRVLKALRIWYTYETDNPKKPGTKMNVGAFLLIGFVGNGHG